MKEREYQTHGAKVWLIKETIRVDILYTLSNISVLKKDVQKDQIGETGRPERVSLMMEHSMNSVCA